MASIKLSFDEIYPFIRYTHYSAIDSNTQFIDIKPYEYRLIYVTYGTAVIKVMDKDYAVMPNHLLIITPGVTYSYQLQKNEIIRIYGVNFDYTCHHSNQSSPIYPEKPRTFNPNKIVETVEFIDMPCLNQVVSISDFPQIEIFLHQIVQEFNCKKKYHQLKMRSYFISLLVEITRQLNDTISYNISSNDIVDTVIQYIQDNYRRDISNATIGELFNFNPTYLSRLFIQHTGLSLHKYIIRHRIFHAIDLLQTTNYSITQISDMVGFSDANYFSRIFKKQTGVTPSYFR